MRRCCIVMVLGLAALVAAETPIDEGLSPEETAASSSLAFGPVESFAIGLHMAKSGRWDDHLAFSLHSSMLDSFEQMLAEEEGGREAFLAMYRSRKYPRQVEFFAQLTGVEPVLYEEEGTETALLVLAEPVGTTVALLMFRDGDHYAFRNYSLLDQEQLAALEARLDDPATE